MCYLFKFQQEPVVPVSRTNSCICCSRNMLRKILLFCQRKQYVRLNTYYHCFRADLPKRILNTIPASSYNENRYGKNYNQ